MKIIQEISTHKAVQEGNEIKIYIKGFDFEAKYPDGGRMWTDGDMEQNPNFFKDEFIYKLDLDEKDDVFALMERYQEENRINLAELNG